MQAVEAGSSAHEAARRFTASESAAIKLVRRVRKTSSTAPARIGGHRKALLCELTTTKPGITLAEIKARLVERGIEAGCLATIWHTLRRLRLLEKQSKGRRTGLAGRGDPSPALAVLAAVHGPGALRVH